MAAFADVDLLIQSKKLKFEKKIKYLIYVIGF